eukprot:symbB.v1.2.032577.t3/scaffold3929.1/size57123/2
MRDPVAQESIPDLVPGGGVNGRVAFKWKNGGRQTGNSESRSFGSYGKLGDGGPAARQPTGYQAGKKEMDQTMI